MTKNDIACRIAEDMGITQTDAKRVVQLVLDEMVNGIASDGRLELREFGVFEVYHRNSRRARNPHSGEMVIVPEYNTVKFKPGKRMEERVTEGNSDELLEEEDLTSSEEPTA